MKERQGVPGDSCQRDLSTHPGLRCLAFKIFKPLLEGSGERRCPLTMAFVRLLTALVRDKSIGKYVVPIVPDEARTFGMEGMFRQLGIYSSVGQLYRPVDADQVMYYREDRKGQILEEGINEAEPCHPGSQRQPPTAIMGRVWSLSISTTRCSGFSVSVILAWAAGDMQARGFLMGGTAGRTTLAGRDCSIRMATVWCRPAPSPIVSLMIRRLPMSLLSSFRMGCGVCSRSRKISSITSP